MHGCRLLGAATRNMLPGSEDASRDAGTLVLLFGIQQLLVKQHAHSPASGVRPTGTWLPHQITLQSDGIRLRSDGIRTRMHRQAVRPGTTLGNDSSYLYYFSAFDVPSG